MFYLSNVPMAFALVYFYHVDSQMIVVSGVVGLTGASAFSFSHYVPWNEPTWTIPVFAFFYICYPAIASRLRRLPAHHMRHCACVLYGAYVSVALLAFAGLPAYAGWRGASQPGLAFGPAYNLAPVQVLIFAMGCCAAHEAAWADLPPRLRALYSLGGACTATSGVASACVTLLVIGICCVQRLATWEGHSEGRGSLGDETMIVKLVVMLLMPPFAYDLLVSLVAVDAVLGECVAETATRGAFTSGSLAGCQEPHQHGPRALHLNIDEHHLSAGADLSTERSSHQGVNSHSATPSPEAHHPWGTAGWAVCLLRSRPLVWLSTISMAFYMIHCVVLTFVLWVSGVAA